MDRHPRRHGQAVGRGLGIRPGFVLLLVTCLTVAIAAARWGIDGLGGGAGAETGGTASSVATGDGDAATTGDGPASGDASPGGGPSGGASASRPSRDGAFLDALAREAAEADLARDGVAARQAWTEDRSLPEAAADVLRAYADEPTARLAMSGYLDIKGDVWGAIVQDARGWVDMVSCTAGEDDASCDVSIVRLMPQVREDRGSEGS